MARPLLVDGKHPMRIFTNNGYRYAVTRTSVRKEDGRYNHPQKIWGTIDEQLNFRPNARFLALSREEREGILIPAEWHVVTEDSASPAKRRGRPSYSGEGASLLYGHTWFLDMLADRCGLRDDLVHVLGDREAADRILTMACYTLVGNGSFSHLAGEQKITWFPAGAPMEAWDVIRLASSVTEDDRQGLFRCRRFRTSSSSWLCIDSTSLTHYGVGLADAKRGRNKEHDPADQVNVLVVYDVTDGAPVYYRRMPGNLPDTRSMRVTLRELRENGFERMNLVLDRGYVSEEVVSMLVRQRHSFVMMTRTTDAQVARAIRETDYDEMTGYANWIHRHGVFGKVLDYRFKILVKGEEREVDSMRMCLFFDPELQGEVRKEVTRKAAEMARQLEDMRRDGDAVDAATLERFSRYFEVRLTKDRRVAGYVMNEENMRRDVAKTGYFAVLTNRMSPSRSDLARILDIYGMRDEQEKSFMFIKSEQGGRRLRTPREDSADGRLFVQFVALILNCQIYRRFLASDTLRKLFPTTRHMLEELRSIRIVQHPRRAKIVTEIVGRQVDVFKEFQLPVPAKLLPKERRHEFEEPQRK